VIYQARALLRLLSNDIVVYEDDCTDGAGEYSRGPQEQHNERIIKDALGQGYIVMPNPTTGNIQLKQLVTDKERVDIKIYNSFGAVVWEGYKYFSNKQSSLQLSFLIPGLYNLMLTDSKGFKTSIHLTKL
ncbi:MAG: T9SS type A sorting domain-containing protein, partial [Chitinophagaceae bacterium]